MSDKTSITPIESKIVIDQTTGESGHLLQNCFFLPTDQKDVYDFYNPSGELLADDIVSGKDFCFELDKFHWDVSNFRIDKFEAHGDWRNDAPTRTGAEDGTFQAQSGGGVPEDEVNESVSLGLPRNAIVIKHVDGGSRREKLKHGYFLPSGEGEYTLFDKHDNELASGLTSDNDFSFPLDSIEWTITRFRINPERASGDWSTPTKENAEDGTFQAQSGGGLGEEETASAASV